MAEQVERAQSQQTRSQVVLEPEDTPLQPAGGAARDYSNDQTVGSVPMLLMDPFLTKTICWPLLAFHSAAQSTPYVQIPLLLRAVTTLFTESQWIQCVEATDAGNRQENVLGIEWSVPTYVAQSVVESGLPRFRETLPGWHQASVRHGTMPSSVLFGESRDDWQQTVRWRTYSVEPSDNESPQMRGQPLIAILSADERNRYNAALDSLGDTRETTYDAIIQDVRHTMRRRSRLIDITLWSFPRIAAGLRTPAPLFTAASARDVSYARWLRDFERVVGNEQAEQAYIRQSATLSRADSSQRTKEGDVVYVTEPLSWPEGAMLFFETHDSSGTVRPQPVPPDPRIRYYIDRFLLAYNRVHGSSSGAQWLEDDADRADKTQRQLAFMKHLAPAAHLLRMTPHVPLPLAFTEADQTCNLDPEPSNGAEVANELRRFAKMLTPQVVGTPLITWALQRRSPEEWRSVLFQMAWTLCAFDTLSVSFGEIDAQSVLVQTVAQPSLAIYRISTEGAFLVPLAQHNVCFTQFHTSKGVSFGLQRRVGQGARRGRRQVYLQQIQANIGTPARSTSYAETLFGGSAGARSIVKAALDDAFADSREPFQFNAATREAVSAIHNQFTRYAVFATQSAASQTLLNEFFTQMLTPQRSVLVQFYQCSLFEKYLVRLPASDLAKHAVQTEAMPVFAMPRTLDARVVKRRTDEENSALQLQSRQRRAVREQQEQQQAMAGSAEQQSAPSAAEESVQGMTDQEFADFLDAAGLPLPAPESTEAELSFEEFVQPGSPPFAAARSQSTGIPELDPFRSPMLPGSPTSEPESERDAFMRELFGQESLSSDPWNMPVADDDIDQFDYQNLQ